MQGEFEMSMMGELNYFLRLKINQLEEGTFVSQTKYCNELLKRFYMENSKVIDTPMPTAVNMDQDENGKVVDIKRYRGMIGSLLYLTHLNQTLCLVYVCVLGINHVPKNHI
jgi:hypothetical protein